MLELQLTASGRSRTDIAKALRAALESIEAGEVTGQGQQDTSTYTFTQTGTDDQAQLEAAGWIWDGDGWSKGALSGLSYGEALTDD
ncbi:hypothetical protein [Deinococcus sp. QL22]|uniref:hypothetical protein n=1 Tax=Deinococcus sp. QL22 TaxID=2939437 RepID=UPI002017541A|nr:hypothetical protein [Deinococcus sp. QL22]UQN05455.1 hypothetical protein M1R55_11275 [Deinococcus sp. QL22]